MKILGLDISYSRTGMAVVDTATISILAYTDCSASKKAVYDLSTSLKLAEDLSVKIKEFIDSNVIDCICVEYPVLATRSGAYLGLIQQALYPKWPNCPVYMVPSQAINSFTKNKVKSKTFLVEWVKERFKIRLNHDIASAVILAMLCQAYLNGEYKNTVNLLKK